MAKPRVEIAWPFHIGPTGGIAIADNPLKIAVQHILQLLYTTPGERVMLPEYGSAVGEYVFENLDGVVGAELGLRIQEALVRWEPEITVHSVSPRTDDYQEGTLLLDVQFSVPPYAEVFTTVVEAGGHISDGSNG